MPLQKSKKKSKKKRVDKDGDIIQSVKQNVVVNVGADDKKKRRGRPRKKSGAPKAPPKPPQFNIPPPPPNAGLVQQIFSPPAPQMQQPIGLRQDTRRLSLNDAVGFQQQQQMGHGTLNPMAETQQPPTLSPAQVRQRRSDMLGTSEREQSMMQDLAELRRELNRMKEAPSASPVPADLRVEAVRAEIINDRSVPSAERLDALEDLRDLLKRDAATRIGGTPDPSPRDIGGVSRSLPHKTIARKATDDAFETPPAQELPPKMTGFLSGEYNVYNDPEYPSVSVVKPRPIDPAKPKKVKRVTLIDAKTGEVIPLRGANPEADVGSPEQKRGRARRRTKAEMAEYRRQQEEARVLGESSKPEPLLAPDQPDPSLLKRDPLSDAGMREEMARQKAQQGDIFAGASNPLRRLTSDEGEWDRVYQASASAPDKEQLMRDYVAFLETDDASS